MQTFGLFKLDSVSGEDGCARLTVDADRFTVSDHGLVTFHADLDIEENGVVPMQETVGVLRLPEGWCVKRLNSKSPV